MLEGPPCSEAVTSDSSASTELCGTDLPECQAKVKTSDQELSGGVSCCRLPASLQVRWLMDSVSTEDSKGQTFPSLPSEG